ncbi:hypothetical protein L226DRAFT_156884 [Lentinus tigrinus ALCF2SS1-7]|uniref:uncharacterized protein n=1 Tax=Lentinus tigrinus ALCF2SS1-7 TaxID=1328758 RepID=UPI001165ED7C|nr:hypothetical protein L226DRAFT_156884 [Lentinus tigrinus ALCF2SS1-7]
MELGETCSNTRSSREKRTSCASALLGAPCPAFCPTVLVSQSLGTRTHNASPVRPSEAPHTAVGDRLVVDVGSGVPQEAEDRARTYTLAIVFGALPPQDVAYARASYTATTSSLASRSRFCQCQHTRSARPKSNLSILGSLRAVGANGQLSRRAPSVSTFRLREDTTLEKQPRRTVIVVARTTAHAQF